MMTRKILLLLCLALTALCASAQSSSEMRKGGGAYNSSSLKSERGHIIGTTMDTKTLPPVGYGKYSDEKLKEMDEAMKERSWSSEDTAWERACEINTRDSYQKYAAMYPYAAHWVEATQKIIDFDVDDIFNKDHGSLPEMKHVECDDFSPTSTVTVTNLTGMWLTVYYSGAESKKVDICPGGKNTVTLPNGQYRIAASVPDIHVRPYAGSETLSGGRYETGYRIVGIW